MHTIKVLSEEDIKKTLSMREAIEVMSDVFSKLSKGELEMPIRSVTDFGDNTVFYKPAASKTDDAVGIKLLTQVNGNRERNLPVIQGLMMLVDYTDGRFLSIMDGTYITALRTAAASGLATKLLARKDARVAAIFGAGAQGRTQLLAICEARNIEKVYIFDLNADAVSEYIKDMSGKVTAELIKGASNECLQEVDVICTVTTSPRPLFRLSELKKGVHINAIGSFKPTMNEIAADVVAASELYLDHKESVIAESGDIINPLRDGVITEAHIKGEIGDAVNGAVQGRTNDMQITLFKSVGVAVQDLATANRVYRKAVAMNLGQVVNL